MYTLNLKPFMQFFLSNVSLIIFGDTNMSNYIPLKYNMRTHQSIMKLMV